MELLLNELVGRSIARQRERELASDLRLREAQAQRGRRPRGSGAPPRHRPRTAPVAARA